MSLPLVVAHQSLPLLASVGSSLVINVTHLSTLDGLCQIIPSGSGRIVCMCWSNLTLLTVQAMVPKVTLYTLTPVPGNGRYVYSPAKGYVDMDSSQKDVVCADFHGGLIALGTAKGIVVLIDSDVRRKMFVYNKDGKVGGKKSVLSVKIHPGSTAAEALVLVQFADVLVVLKGGKQEYVVSGGSPIATPQPPDGVPPPSAMFLPSSTIAAPRFVYASDSAKLVVTGPSPTNLAFPPQFGAVHSIVSSTPATISVLFATNVLVHLLHDVATGLGFKELSTLVLDKTAPFCAMTASAFPKPYGTVILSTGLELTVTTLGCKDVTTFCDGKDLEVVCRATSSNTVALASFDGSVAILTPVRVGPTIFSNVAPIMVGLAKAGDEGRAQKMFWIGCSIILGVWVVCGR
jgi:hypothetical protein